MPPKRRQVSFAVSPTPPPRSRVAAKQRIAIKTGSWTGVPLAPGSTETTKLSPVPIPTNIHIDLQSARIIPDPHAGTNERDIQWVHERAWEFETEFFLTLPSLAGRKAELVFEGLDTFATVRLNGKEILECENMFLEHRVDITDTVLLMGKQNSLTIVFHSAMQRGAVLMEKYGQRVCWNGHYNRPYVRKAQYHYGWDWGPSLVTCGPWKPIYIDVYSAQISEVSVVPTLSADLEEATLELRATIDSATDEDLVVNATITLPGGMSVASGMTSHNGNVYKQSRTLNRPDLWYPRTHGAQNLHEVAFHLYSGDTHLHTVTKKLGLRRVELVQDALPEVDGDNLSGGTTFYFRINNIPVFCGGCNWIPADSFQPRITRERLEALLGLMVRGNQKMVRVWGGGIYESEEFYEICDKAGILVWQDILMACADYPAHLDYFADSILEEVEQNLKRLRWHPSLVIAAGSNEDYQVADEELGYDKDAPEDTWRKEPFPSRWLYEKKFGEIVKRVCNGDEGGLVGDAGKGASGVVYWPGSPFGGEDSTDRTVGDIHQWNSMISLARFSGSRGANSSAVWGGIQAPYQRYPDLGGRFVSEFGMPSFPSLPGIPYLLGSAPDNHPQSEAIAHHTKAHSFEKRLHPYILENYRITNGSMAEIVYLSQLVQSEAMSFAFRGWRRRWGSRGCGGALVWQLNDVWPAISWSITSFPDLPKPAFYAISRALRPVAIISRRHTNDPKPNSKVEALCNNKTAKAGKAAMHSTPHIYPPKRSTIDITLSNISHLPIEDLRVEIRYIAIIDSTTSTILSRDSVVVPANSEISLVSNTVVPEDKPTAVFAICYDAKGQVVARDVDWPQPMKFVDSHATPGPQLQWWEGGVIISAARCIKGLVFEEFGGEVWDDNGVDVVSGSVLAIKVLNLKKGPRKMWWYGCGKW